MICFEFPLAEKIRTLLRLEDIFKRLAFFQQQEQGHAHYIALVVLFELLDLAGRLDLKSELVQELDKQKHILEGLRDNPLIAEDSLDATLERIEQTSAQLLENSGRLGHHLREHEWLNSVRQRANIAGGVNEFDLPSLHYWQSLASTARGELLQQWVQPLLVVKEAVDTLLKLLRHRGKKIAHLAPRGAFQQMSGGNVFHLLRLEMAADITAIPEISASKYAVNVRFITPNFDGGGKQVIDQAIPFTMTYCKL